MNVASAFGKYGAAGIQGGVSPRQAAQKATAPASSSFAGVLDQVSISQEAKMLCSSSQASQKKVESEVGDFGELTFVARALENWHKKYFEEGNRSPDQNSEAWLPENRAQLHAIWAEMDKIVAAEPDTLARSGAANKRLNDLMAQRTVLEVFGTDMVVTDDVMTVGVTAFQAAEKKYIESEMNKRQEEAASPVKTYLSRLFPEDPQELEEKIKEREGKQSSKNSTKQQA